MIERLIFALVTQLASQLLTWVLSRHAKKTETAVTESEVDQKLSTVKVAYTKALDGNPITKEQRAELNKAFSDFVRSPDSRGGL